MSKPNVIFLDIDGVLNTTVSRNYETGYHFDRSSIEFVRSLIHEHNCEVVVSSTWRHGMRMSDMCTMLHIAGLGFCLFSSKKKDSKDSWRTVSLAGEIRGKEIQQWLDTYGDEIRSYVILDDDRDMLESQLGNFIHTDHFTGVSYREYNEALVILGDDAAIDHSHVDLTPIKELEKRTARLLDGYEEIAKAHPDIADFVQSIKREKF